MFSDPASCFNSCLGIIPPSRVASRHPFRVIPNCCAAWSRGHGTGARGTSSFSIVRAAVAAMFSSDESGALRSSRAVSATLRLLTELLLLRHNGISEWAAADSVVAWRRRCGVHGRQTKPCTEVRPAGRRVACWAVWRATEAKNRRRGGDDRGTHAGPRHRWRFARACARCAARVSSHVA